MRFSKIKEKSVLILLIVMTLVIVTGSMVNDRQQMPEIKNVILMVPDGTSISHVTISRWYNGGEKLALDEIMSGFTRTYWKDGIITDSSAAATAYSTGIKTKSGCVGVLPHEDTENDLQYNKPIATIIEAANRAGLSTGIVCTSQLSDATPAGFSSHVNARTCINDIVEQQVYSDIDVLLCGGYNWYFSGNEEKNRKDGRVLKDEIVNNGYEFVTTKEELLNSKSNKIWGAFEPVSMTWDMFLDKDKYPAIDVMTNKAIEVLSKNEKGFFLMVEGSKVDWASHRSDSVGVISEVLAFDRAVGEALKFAKSRTDTVVIVSPDHGNGGLSIGGKTTDYNYDKLSVDAFIDPLKKVDYIPRELPNLLNEDKSNIRELMEEHMGVYDLTDEEEELIRNAEGKWIGAQMNKALSKRANLAWTTRGHTGEDVFLACYHPKGEGLRGVIENIDINHYIASIFGVDLQSLSDKLFVEAKTAFEKKGYDVSFKDGAVRELVVSNGKDILRLPYNKNIAYLNDEEIKLSGINVYTGTYIFVAEDTLTLLDK